MFTSFVELYKALRTLPHPAIIAISGFGGAGKSTLAGMLATELRAPVISIDAFNRGFVEYSLWETMEYERLLQEVVRPFRQGQNEIIYTHQDGESAPRTTKLQPAGSIVIEGVGLFRPETNDHFDYKIWINCPIEVAAARGKKRDRELWHNPKDALWDGLWKKNDLEYFEKYRPNAIADFIVENSINSP